MTDKLQDFFTWLRLINRELFPMEAQNLFDYEEVPWGDWFREGLSVKQATERFNTEE